MIPKGGSRVANAYRNRNRGLTTKAGQRNNALLTSGDINMRQRDRRVIRAGLRKRRPSMTRAERVSRSRTQERALHKYNSVIRTAAGVNQ